MILRDEHRFFHKRVFGMARFKRRQTQSNANSGLVRVDYRIVVNILVIRKTDWLIVCLFTTCDWLKNINQVSIQWSKLLNTLKDIDGVHRIVKHLNWTVEDLTEGLYLDVVAMAVFISFPLDICCKIFSNILRKVITVFLLQKNTIL